MTEKRMQVDLTGRVAIVTGGARDIGAAVSRRLAECGAVVTVNYSASADRAATVVDEITKSGGTALAIKADVTRALDVQRLVDETRAAFGDHIDILVNNAGGLIGRKTLSEMDETFLDTVLDLNLKSVFLVTKAVLPYLSDGGAIVNLSSLAARDGGGGGAIAYASAKGGVLTFTRALSKELASRRIRVNCVSPGLIDTTFHDTFTKPEVRKAVAARTSMGREGTSDDVADAVLFLASPASSYITGESIEINGGVYFI
jgi:3-oxoacyl-[acyl-carrier protein] reductase